MNYICQICDEQAVYRGYKVDKWTSKDVPTFWCAFHGEKAKADWHVHKLEKLPFFKTWLAKQKQDHPSNPDRSLFE